MNDAKQVNEPELERLRKKIVADMDYARKIKLAKLVMAVVFQIFGYFILIYMDWRIALAVFLIQWAIQLTIPRRIK